MGPRLVRDGICRAGIGVLKRTKPFVHNEIWASSVRLSFNRILIIVHHCEIIMEYSWVSRDLIISLGVNTQLSEGNSFSLYVLTLCLAANMCNFVRFFHSSTAKSSIHFGLTPTQINCKTPVKPKNY